MTGDQRLLHVLKSGCRWCDCPPEYGPPTTIYNRFVRWAERSVWEHLFRELADRGSSTDTQMIDSTHIKAHCSASGGKGGRRTKRLDTRAAGEIRKSTIADAKGRLLSILLSGVDAHDCPPAEPLIEKTKPARRLLADTAYDSAALRGWLRDRGTKPVIPNKSNRKQPFSFDRKSHKQRHLIENAFCRLKDFRRIATRYDRLARNLMASIHLVAAIIWWSL